MLTVREVWEVIDARVRPLPARTVPLAEAAGLVLAEPLIADGDQPACDHSAMDGYAVREEAEAGFFELAGEILPGDSAGEPPERGSAIRVFTGSALPPGVKVAMREDVVAVGGGIRIATLERSGHVRRRGAAAKKGETLIEAGTLLSPAGAAILASNGLIAPRVIPRPAIAHLTTGREIVPPERRPSDGQVRNSNATLLRALAGNVIARAHSGEDTGESLAACSTGGFGEADLVVVSGGASVGDHDHTGELLEALGFGIVCRKVAVRPGKPFIMGLRGDRAAVGLPGNPVSHFATFHLFVQRILDRMSGRPVAQGASARLRDPGGILEPGKLETWWPAVWGLRDATVEAEPKPWLHSGHLSALAGANALLRIPAGAVPADGESVSFLPCGQPVILPP